MPRFKIINGRTGEVRVVPGYWWVLFKSDGSWSIVEVGEYGPDNLCVWSMGAEESHSVEETAKHYEFMMLITQPI